MTSSLQQLHPTGSHRAAVDGALSDVTFLSCSEWRHVKRGRALWSMSVSYYFSCPHVQHIKLSTITARVSSSRCLAPPTGNQGARKWLDMYISLESLNYFLLFLSVISSKPCKNTYDTFHWIFFFSWKERVLEPQQFTHPSIHICIYIYILYRKHTFVSSLFKSRLNTLSG